MNKLSRDQKIILLFMTVILIIGLLSIILGFTIVNSTQIILLGIMCIFSNMILLPGILYVLLTKV